MTTYKLTAEEIRRRAKDIAIYNSVGERIIELIEDATGEKLPEGFPKHLAVDGSTWRDHYKTVVLIFQDTGSSPTVAVVVVESDCGCFLIHGKSIPLDDVFRILEGGRFSYIGQYDFAAGLPQSK